MGVRDIFFFYQTHMPKETTALTWRGPLLMVLNAMGSNSSQFCVMRHRILTAYTHSQMEFVASIYNQKAAEAQKIITTANEINVHQLV